MKSCFLRRLKEHQTKRTTNLRTPCGLGRSLKLCAEDCSTAMSSRKRLPSWRVGSNATVSNSLMNSQKRRGDQETWREGDSSAGRRATRKRDNRDGGDAAM